MQGLLALFLADGCRGVDEDAGSLSGRTTRYRQSPPWLLGDGPVVPQPGLVLCELEHQDEADLVAFAAKKLQQVREDGSAGAEVAPAGCYVQVSQRQGAAGGLARAILLVFTNAASPEQEAEFNTWYDGTHLPDVLRVPGFVAATRYRAVGGSSLGVSRPTSHAYLAVYELDAGDGEGLAAAAAALGEATRGANAMYISPALDRSTARGQFYIREARGE
ncbi:MAG: hypothetical protein IT304_08170 [Dehalococcoidia bacterium]|nr:hypothetical protein [Dehalococcoidia bacterium]